MSDLAPAPKFPERAGTQYERKVTDVRSNYNASRKGPLRFEEGLGSDTDVPSDFSKGVMQGLVSAPGRPNHNQNVYEKPAAETMKERAHVGSAAWVESNTYLGEFAHGAFSDADQQVYEQVTRNGARQQRPNAAVVND